MKSMDRSTHYQICLEGKLDERWLRWFEGLKVASSPDNQTIIRGEFDQSALHGLFNRIRDLGVTIISVQRLPDRKNPHIEKFRKDLFMKTIFFFSLAFVLFLLPNLA